MARSKGKRYRDQCRARALARRRRGRAGSDANVTALTWTPHDAPGPIAVELAGGGRLMSLDPAAPGEDRAAATLIEGVAAIEASIRGHLMDAVTERFNREVAEAFTPDVGVSILQQAYLPWSQAQSTPLADLRAMQKRFRWEYEGTFTIIPRGAWQTAAITGLDDLLDRRPSRGDPIFTPDGAGGAGAYREQSAVANIAANIAFDAWLGRPLALAGGKTPRWLAEHEPARCPRPAYERARPAADEPWNHVTIRLHNVWPRGALNLPEPIRTHAEAWSGEYPAWTWTFAGSWAPPEAVLRDSRPGLACPGCGADLERGMRQVGEYRLSAVKAGREPGDSEAIVREGRPGTTLVWRYEFALCEGCIGLPWRVLEPAALEAVIALGYLYQHPARITEDFPDA
jgi:hypothetical protein